MSGEIHITIGHNSGDGEEVIFSKIGFNRITIIGKSSAESIEFDLDWLINLDWQNLKQIRKTLATQFYRTTGEAHVALMAARQLLKRPNVISVNNYLPGLFKIEKEKINEV